MKKYELTEDTKTLADGTVLHRIRALRDFTLVDGTKVREGDLGGWVERDDNLSQDGEAWVYGSARVCGSACVSGSAWVCGSARVCGSAWVSGDAWVCGSARVCGEAWVYGEACVCGDAYVCGSASVSDICDYAVYKNTWSSGRWFTYTRSNRMWKVGCFHGTGEELIAKAYKDSELSGRCYEAIVRAQEAVDRAIEKKRMK